MKVIHPVKALAVLCAVAMFWTACQKEVSTAGDEKLENQQTLRLSGVVPDDPELVRKVPVLMSAGFAAEYSLLKGGARRDRDGDGIPDNVDACPTQKETVNGYQDTDGCPDTVPTATDTDGDGIPDTSDACPTQAETLNGYQDTDGCPDTVPDTDSDGIDDLRDACPTQPETFNGYEDTDGCPDTIITIPPTTIPPSFQLVMPPVGQQGGEFSCVSWAVTTARSVEWYYKTKATSYNTITNIFSPEYLYNQAKVSAECSSGSGIYTCLNIIKNQGVCTWQSMPYSDANGCSLLPNSTQIAEAVSYKIGSFSLVLQTDQVAIKTLLSQNHPLIAGTSIDNNFTNATPGFIWNNFNSPYGTNHGYVICGYDDVKKAYKAINSWGTAWGDNGYIWIDYDFFGTLPGSVYVMQNTM